MILLYNEPDTVAYISLVLICIFYFHFENYTLMITSDLKFKWMTW